MYQQRLAYYACLPYFCLFVCAQDTHPNPAPTTYVLHSLVLQYSRSAPVHDIDGWKSLVSQLSTECSAALEGGYGAVKARGWQRWRAASARRRRKCHPARSAQRRGKQAFCLHSQPYYHHKLVQCLDNLRSKVPTAARARLPSPCRTARQPKLTSIGKSDLSARPKRKYASLRNDGQINETGSACMNILSIRDHLYIT